jgi:hypothetical protein
MGAANARRLSVGIRVAFACFVVSSWQCSLLIDTTGLSGGGAPDALADGVGASSDGPGGGGLVDAGAGFRDCDATPHELCDDFDNGALGVRWSGQMRANGILELSPNAGLSPPAALHSSVTRPPAGGASAAALYKDIVRSASLVSCELDVQILDGSFQALDVSFENDGSLPRYGVSVNVGNTTQSAHMREYTFSQSNVYTLLNEYPLPAITAKVWHHASLVISIAGGRAGSVKLAIDRASAVDTPLTPKPALRLSRIILSENYIDRPFDALFDNVHCDIR